MAAEHWTIEIIDSREKGNNDKQGTPATPLDESAPAEKSPTNIKGKGKQISGIVIGAYIGSQALSYATTRVEQFTGSQQEQNAVSSAVKVAGYAAAIFANPVMGTIALGMDIATNAIDYSHKMYWNNKETAQYRERTGYSETNRR